MWGKFGPARYSASSVSCIRRVRGVLCGGRVFVENSFVGRGGMG